MRWALTILGGLLFAAGFYLGLKAAIVAVTIEESWIVLVGAAEAGIAGLIGWGLLVSAQQRR